MVQEAAEMEEEDKMQREKVEARNKLEGYAYQVKNVLKDEKKSAGIEEDRIGYGILLGGVSVATGLVNAGALTY